MANLADLAQDERQRELDILTTPVTNNFTLIYEDKNGVLISVGKLPSSASKCYVWLEGQGVDVEHGAYAFGYKRVDGSHDTKWHHPHMLVLLDALLKHPIS